MNARPLFPRYQIALLTAIILAGIGLVALQERTLIHDVIFGCGWWAPCPLAPVPDVPL
jgi:hypothetical protein